MRSLEGAQKEARVALWLQEAEFPAARLAADGLPVEPIVADEHPVTLLASESNLVDRLLRQPTRGGYCEGCTTSAGVGATGQPEQAPLDLAPEVSSPSAISARSGSTVALVVVYSSSSALRSRLPNRSGPLGI